MACELFDKSDRRETNDCIPLRGPKKIHEIKGYLLQNEDLTIFQSELNPLHRKERWVI